MNKCESLHRMYLLSAIAKNCVAGAKAQEKALADFPPPMNIIMAATVLKTFELQEEKLAQLFKSGPICGSQIIKNGKLTSGIL